MKVMVFGSFDTLHDGHRDFFKQASTYGEVIAVVAKDSTIRSLKNREPRSFEDERLSAVAKEPTISKALLGHTDDFFAVVQEEQPDILFLGYDQHTFSDAQIRQELAQKNLHPRILRGTAFHPEKFKSSKLCST